MSTRMLIDARHSEETRVTVIRGKRVEEFDYESANKVQLKGNIYLAKVTRVEPSLQAAFIEYGGDRHGFLAFSEIHPDYYQIPVEDREALLAAEREANARDEAAEKAAENSVDGEGKKARPADDDDDAGDAGGDDAEAAEYLDGDGDDDNGEELDAADDDNNGEDEIAENIRQRRRMRSLKRRYKIQEVIKRRQILLVQVVKEERGTKGAALTTYLSLAGRYCVVMPNSTHGGGVSRKISNIKDRKKLKTILGALQATPGMGCIIRTAGLQRTKAEIKRDYDYLIRLWGDIRALTLKSVAPALIYEEGNLIKRSIRDLYDRSIDEVLVEGEEAYKAAKSLMKLLMPSHAKRVQHYEDKIPLFHRYQVEEQLDSMFNPLVTLNSGGYLIINPTEALISVDVNSGRSTREHNIEETALKTNLEAAEEVGRQLRLRDMAGLVVIDFIDMEHRSNNRKIERRLKEALKADRARIQVGRISQFGLLEMSRQRLRPNLVEVSTVACQHCDGTGRARTIESSALHVLRALEEEGIRERSTKLRLAVPGDVAIYILNEKRSTLLELERNYRLKVEVVAEDKLFAPHYEMTRCFAGDDGSEVSEVITDQAEVQYKAGKETGGRQRQRQRRRDRDESAAAPAEAPASEAKAEEDGDKPRKRRRRGRRGGRRRKAAIAAASGEPTAAAAVTAAAETPEQVAESAPPDHGEEAKKKPARGRRRKAEIEAGTTPAVAAPDAAGDTSEAKEKVETGKKAKAEGEIGKDKAAKKPRRSRKAASDTAAEKPAKRAGKPAAAEKRAEKAKAGADPGADATDATRDAAGIRAENGAKDEAGAEAKSAAKHTAPRKPAKTKAAAGKTAADKEPETGTVKSGNGASVDQAVVAGGKESEMPGQAVKDAKTKKPRRGWWQRG